MTYTVVAYRNLVVGKLNDMIREHAETATHCRSQGRYQDAAYAEAQERAVRKVLEQVLAIPRSVS